MSGSYGPAPLGSDRALSWRSELTRLEDTMWAGQKDDFYLTVIKIVTTPITATDQMNIQYQFMFLPER